MFADLVRGQAADVAIGLGQIFLAADGIVDFGCQHDGVAPSAALREPLADDFLCQAVFHLPPIDIGGIEKVYAQFQGAVHDGEGVCFRRLPAKIHRAQAKIAHQHAVPSKSSVFN